MSAIESVLRSMDGYSDRVALIQDGSQFTYNDLSKRINYWVEELSNYGVKQGSVCSLLGDFNLDTCSIIFSLMKLKAICVPITSTLPTEIEKFKEIAEVEISIDARAVNNLMISKENCFPKNLLTINFIQKKVPGLIVFSSGSTGLPKGILHNCEHVMQKFTKKRDGWRTVLFLLMDHFGGFNTLLGALAYGGVAICLNNRSPDAVCRVISETGASLLPTTPSFINLLIASRSYKKFNMDSIALVTYGTEVMPESTLRKLREIFPGAEFKQTYGLSEVGVLKSKSEGSDSLWLKVGGEGFDVKVRDGILWIRSEANMVGYLNAPSPFDDEGWMCTGDHVEIKGEFMRIIGRKSEMINVGGQKVFPTEVESVILLDDNVKDVTAFGVKHDLMGQVVHANISLENPEDIESFISRIRLLCKKNLSSYKIPVKFLIMETSGSYSPRFKKRRPT